MHYADALFRLETLGIQMSNRNTRKPPWSWKWIPFCKDLGWYIITDCHTLYNIHYSLSYYTAYIIHSKWYISADCEILQPVLWEHCICISVFVFFIVYLQLVLLCTENRDTSCRTQRLNWEKWVGWCSLAKMISIELSNIIDHHHYAHALCVAWGGGQWKHNPVSFYNIQKNLYKN